MVMLRRLLATLLALLTCWPTLALAQQQKAGVVTTLEGTVTATRPTASPVALKFKDDVFLRDRIATGDRSLARMLLGGKAVVTVRERSVLSITEIPGRSTVDIESGKLSLAVARDKMRPGEQIEIRTPNALAAVRGTVVVAEVVRATAQAGPGAPTVSSNFYVLRGSVQISQLDPATRAPVGTPQTVNVLQSYSATGNQQPRVATITAEQVVRANSGLQPRGVQATEAANSAQVRDQVMQATTGLITALLGPAPGPSGGGGPAGPASTTSSSTPSSTTPPPLIPFQPDQVQSQDQDPDFVLSGISATLPAPLRTANSRVNRFSLNPAVRLIDASLTLSGTEAAISALPGADVTLASSVLSATNSMLNVPRELLLIRGGIVTGNSGDAFARFTNSTLNGVGSFAAIENGRLSLVAPMLVASGSTLTSGVESGPGANTVPFIFVRDGAVIQDSSPAAFVQLANSAVSSTGSFFTARSRLGGPAPTVDLAGPLLTATGGSIRSFSSTFLDQGGARQLCCNLLAVGQGARFTSAATSSLIQLNGTTLNLGNRVITIFDFTSIAGEPTVVATPSVTLAGGLLSASGGSIAALQSVLGVFRGTLSSTTTDALLAFDGSTIASGGPSPIDGSTTTGRLVTLARSNSTGNPDVSTVNLRGPLWRSSNATITTTDDAFGIFDSSRLTSISAEPLISITGGSLTVNGAGNVLSASSATGNQPVSVALAGSLIAATNATIRNGNPASNTQSVVFVGNGTSMTGTGTGPLMSFNNTTVDTSGNVFTLRNSVSQADPTLTIAGPLLLATNNSLFDTTSQGSVLASGSPTACCSGFLVGQGGRLTGTGTGPLIQLTNSTFNAGPDSQSGGNFFGVQASINTETLMAPATVTLAGGLLSLASSSVTSLFSTLSVSSSTFTSTASTLITLTSSSLSAGGTNALNGIAQGAFLLVLSQSPGTPAASVSLAGPLLSATDSTVTTTTDTVGVFSGSSLTSTTTAPLISINNSTLTAGSGSLSGRVLTVSGAGGPSSTTPASVTLNGPLLSVASTLNANQGLVGVLANGKLQVNGSTDALVSFSGGTHSVATASGSAMFNLAGRSSATIDESAGAGTSAGSVTVTRGTDVPLSHGGVFMDATNNANFGSGSTRQFYLQDTALVEASMPILQLRAGAALTTAVDAIDLTKMAKLTNTGSLVALDASTLTVNSGYAVRVNNSMLRVDGDLFSFRNSTLQTGLNVMSSPGAPLLIEGTAVVTINRAMYAFEGGTNAVRINNTFCGTSCALTVGTGPGAIQIHLDGASSTQVSAVNPTRTAANGASFTIFRNGNGSPTGGPATADIVLRGTSSRLIINGN